MKIISPFRDYYDNVHWGPEDTNVQYLRKPQVLNFNGLRLENRSLSQELYKFRSPEEKVSVYDNPALSIRPTWAVISVCGKLYTVLLSEEYSCKHYWGGDSKLENYLTHFDTLHLPTLFAEPAGVVTNFAQHWIGILEARIQRTGKLHPERIITEQELKRFQDFMKSDKAKKMFEEMDERQGTPAKYPDLHLEHKVPVFIMLQLGNRILTNPPLRWVGLEKILDPYQAHQEIETYLGNVLTTPDDAPCTVGGDEVVARQKGFDQYSFRTQAPGHKKINRAMNKARKRAAAKNTKEI